MKADILFIHPGNQKRVYQDLSKEYTAIAPPVWTCLLAENARINGYSVAIYDVNVDGWDDKVPGELIAKYNPELIVIMVYGHTPSSSTLTMPAARFIAKDIKSFNKSMPIALGGIHPSALPEKTLREEPVDYVIQGEGTYTISSLIACIKGKKSLNDVQGLWYWKGDSICSTPRPAVAEILDADLPNYAWDLLPDFGRYRAHNMHCFQDFADSKKDDFSDVRSPYVSMNTSLGCPYACHYCCINSVFGKPGIRYWSIDRVMTWFDFLHGKGVRNVRLDDELFILSPKRVEELCDRLIERKYGLNIWVYGRVDTINEPLLRKLKRAGINWICLGIESANALVRNSVNKVIRKDIAKTVKAIRDNGIYVLGNYMFGLPEDNLETMNETLQMAIDLQCEYINFYTVMAYPGSELYESARKEGHLPASWDSFSQHGYDTQPLPTKYLSAAEVLKFRDDAFVKYFTNEKFLAMVTSTFGNRVRKHIEKMLNVKVRRRLTESLQQNTQGVPL